MHQETGTLPPPTLTAFYDLEVSPISYDFAIFLTLAEIERRRAGADSVHIVIVPTAEGQFRNDDAEYDAANKRWRLHNILLPLCAAAPSPISISLCRDRGEAARIEAGSDGPRFPEGYATNAPTAGFMWSQVASASARGEAVPSLRAGAEARRSMEAWLGAHCGSRRPVTVTLRESSHFAARNSNTADWLQFARELDRDRYCPVIIRDTERIFAPASSEFDGILCCPLASLNLDLRLALYELAWLNLGIPNGPTALFWLNAHIRFLMFGMINENAPGTSSVFVASQGLPHGGQLPHATPFQRLVWEPDNADVITREFAAMTARIGDTPPGTESAPDPGNAEDPLAVAVRLQATGRFEEATAIYQDIIGKDPKNADAWHMLGIIAHQAERPDAAEKMILHAISLSPDRANYFINLAAVLRKADRQDEAANCLWRAIALAPNDAGAHADLAELLQAQGANEKAKAALLKAIRLRPDSPELCERAARVLHVLGHAEEAANLYRRAIDLREEAQERARQARAHMSEIPVTTLKSA